MLKSINIQIVYLKPGQQWQQSLTVNLGCTIHQALNQVDFFKLFQELTVNNIELGVFGIKKQLSDVLKSDDRIEIYRPLICDPKKARLERHRRPAACPLDPLSTSGSRE